MLLTRLACHPGPSDRTLRGQPNWRKLLEETASLEKEFPKSVQDVADALKGLGRKEARRTRNWMSIDFVSMFSRDFLVQRRQVIADWLNFLSVVDT